MFGLFLLFIVIILPTTITTFESDDECLDFKKSPLNNILLIGMINKEQLLLITTNSKVYRITYNDDPKSGDVTVDMTANPTTTLNDYYPALINDARFKRSMSQNLIRHSFIFLWRTRLRMIFIADETIEYYPDWLEVQNNRFRLPSIETIPLSIYDPNGKILFMLDIKSNEVKIQSIFLDAFPCDIFDMENIISNQQYRHICYGSGKNSIYIETSIERRCLTPVKLLVRIGFISNVNVYLITEKNVYFFSRQALTNTGKNYHFYKISTTTFFQCKEKDTKEKKTFEPVNDDEPIYDDHWKQKTTNFHDKSTKIDHSSEFNLNYLWIVLAVIASIFLLIIFYLHRLIRKRKISRIRNYGPGVSSSIMSNISSSRMLSMRSRRSPSTSSSSTSMIGRFFTSRGGGSPRTSRSPTSRATSTLRQSTRRPSTRSPLSSSPTRNIFRSRGGGGGMSMKN